VVRVVGVARDATVDERGGVVKALVVIPTLNEIDNIEHVLRALRAAAPTVDVLVVDDDSPDGTAARAETLARELGAVHVLRRQGRPGLGAAYRDGFAFALAHRYDVAVEMDADLSHEPTAVSTLLDAVAAGADLALGSRNVPGGATPGWPRRRRLLSRAGGAYARWMLGLTCHDPTGGFRAYRTALLRECELATVDAMGFGFQVEMVHRASRLGARVVEVPIVFHDRELGESKMTPAIAKEALRLVARLARHPWNPSRDHTGVAGSTPSVLGI
jgi:dolichol-phosphate mannosyltransferase